MEKILEKYQVPCQMNWIGSLGSLFFTKTKVENYETAKTSDTAAFAEYFKYMLSCGIHLAPSQFEAMFLSAAHGKAEIQETQKAMEDYFKATK